MQVYRVPGVLAHGGKRKPGDLCRGGGTGMSLEGIGKNFQGNRVVERVVKIASTGMKGHGVREEKLCPKHWICTFKILV